MPAKPTVKSTIKKHVLESLLEGGNVILHINPKVKEKVVLPPDLDEAFNVVLCIGLNTPYPIPDLTLSDIGVEATLTINREEYFCSLPWKSIYYMGLVGDIGRGWPEDAPMALLHHWHLRLAQPFEELRNELENEGVSTVYEESEPAKKKYPFTIISGDGEASSSHPVDSHFLTLLTPSSD